MNIVYQLPKLFIISNNKKRFWEIWIEKKNDIYYIVRNYGIIGGKLTNPEKKICKTFEKAKTAVNALWRKKKESGFNEININSKRKSNVIKPMGAHKLNDFYHKIIYPALVQKKLDGFRCISHVNNNTVIMYSKGMKQFIYLNHIKNEILKIKELLKNNNIYLDGELYEKGVKLHEISSLVMKKYATINNENKMKQISYYIFDTFDINNLNIEFKDRYKKLVSIFKNYHFKYLKLVTCEIVYNLDQIKDLDKKYLYEGFEGVIVRNKNGIYKLNAKSYDVLRTKEFKKKDFEIIGAKEGTGTQKGAIIWILKCLNNYNKTFSGIPIGTLNERKEIYKKYINNPNLYIGKKARVKFLEITIDGCISRNPIVEEIEEI